MFLGAVGFRRGGEALAGAVGAAQRSRLGVKRPQNGSGRPARAGAVGRPPKEGFLCPKNFRSTSWSCIFKMFGLTFGTILYLVSLKAYCQQGERVVRPWPRLPREAVAAPSLAGLKARLDGAWSSLGWWKRSLLMAGGWNRIICKVPSSPNHSVIL